MTDAITKGINFVNGTYRSNSELPFPGSHPPLNEFLAEDLHETQVVKQIVTRYIKLRLYHHARGITEREILKNKTSIRQKLNKLVLFGNV